jgi:hypothetical protein
VCLENARRRFFRAPIFPTTMAVLRSAANRQGVVVRAEDSYAGLEKAARNQDAKGVYFQRGPHQREADIKHWLGQHSDGDICCKTLLVAPPVPGPEDECGCGDTSCDSNTGSGGDNASDLAGPAEIRVACAKLVAELPASFRESVRHDARLLADMCVRLCPAAPWLTLSLEVQHHNACTRWHQDSVVSRAIICYTGPGTCTADDQSVRWDKIERSNTTCVPRAEMKQMSTNSVLLMKGLSWPSIRGSGLTHKSPRLGSKPSKRLLLKVDLQKGLRNPESLWE